MYADRLQVGVGCLSTMPMGGEEENLNFGDSDMVIRYGRRVVDIVSSEISRGALDPPLLELHQSGPGRAC